MSNKEILIFCFEFNVETVKYIYLISPIDGALKSKMKNEKVILN